MNKWQLGVCYLLFWNIGKSILLKIFPIMKPDLGDRRLQTNCSSNKGINGS